MNGPIALSVVTEPVQGQSRFGSPQGGGGGAVAGGQGASVLPQSCQDLFEVAADASHPFRAAPIAAAAGQSLDQARVKGLRSQRAGREQPDQPLPWLREWLCS